MTQLEISIEDKRLEIGSLQNQLKNPKTYKDQEEIRAKLHQAIADYQMLLKEHRKEIADGRTRSKVRHRMG